MPSDASLHEIESDRFVEAPKLEVPPPVLKPDPPAPPIQKPAVPVFKTEEVITPVF